MTIAPITLSPLPASPNVDPATFPKEFGRVVQGFDPENPQKELIKDALYRVRRSCQCAVIVS